MSAPRTKRQFAGAASDPNQRSITSFFERRTGSPNDYSPPTDYTTGPLSPPVPGQVQANLLAVGMRVRKSVPEGYKTGNKYGGFSLWQDNTAPASSHQSPPSTTFFQQPTPATAPPLLSSSPRELLPFCGINKVGGLAVQPDPSPMPAAFFTPSALDGDNNTTNPPPPAVSISVSPPDVAVLPELDDLPGLTSSQDSVASTASYSSISSGNNTGLPYLQPYSTNSKKRVYTDDTTTTALSVPVPHDPSLWRGRRDWDGQVSPRSLAPVGWEKNARVMAVPRGVRKAAGPVTAGNDLANNLRDLGQENRVVAVVAGDGGGVDDFEEAEFLDYMELEP